jgi:Fe-S cluster biosynthesis and repair protein YggX
MSSPQCARCSRKDFEPMGRAPFADELGARIAGEVCVECWAAWKKHQMLLINHYGLNLRDRAARDFLVKNLRSFLFSEGEGEEIDTSKEGEITW